MSFHLFRPKFLDNNTTGYKIRKRRKELDISAQQLSNLSGVSKSNILASERTEKYLNPQQFKKVCQILNINSNDIIDNEYKFFFKGYKEPLDLLIQNIGLNELISYLNVKKQTLLNWQLEKQVPNFKTKRKLIKKYNEIKTNIKNKFNTKNLYIKIVEDEN